MAEILLNYVKEKIRKFLIAFEYQIEIIVSNLNC